MYPFGMRPVSTDQTVTIKDSGGSTWDFSVPAGVSAVIDTDGTLAANSDVKMASQKATKTYVDTRIRYAKVALTSADLKALVATPKELVANPGAGKAVVLHTLICDFSYLTHVYTDAGGIVTINCGANALETTADLSALLQAAASAITQLQIKDAALLSANQNVVLKKITNELAAGSGTLNVHVFYTVVTL